MNETIKIHKKLQSVYFFLLGAKNASQSDAFLGVLYKNH